MVIKITEDQLESLIHAYKYKTRLFGYLRDTIRINYLKDLVKKGLLKEERPSKVGSYLRFELTKEGKKLVKDWMKRRRDPKS